MWFWLFADPDSGGKIPPDAAADSGEKSQASPSADAAPPEDTDEPEEELLEEEHAPPSAMWVVLPWMTSLLLHVAVIVLGLVLVWSVMIIEEEQEAIVPIARLSENVGGALAQSDSEQFDAAQDVREVDSEEVDTEDSMEEMDLSENEVELVGLSGGGAGGSLAPFGTTSSGGEAGAEFYGTGGNARRIAYVIDASGSMIDTMPFVLEELKRSISELSDRQEFTIIFYQADGATEVPPQGWKPANDEFKRRVADWVTLEHGNLSPRGSTNPQPALRLVMRYRPELLFVLSDNITGSGRYEINREELLSMLKQTNPNQRTAINTIQFIYPDQLETLKQIAEEHGGIYKFITEADLGLR
ncbi:MAG: hypothetical protein WD294_15975 [Phycisphaeraceae bacterium]